MKALNKLLQRMQREKLFRRQGGGGGGGGSGGDPNAKYHPLAQYKHKNATVINLQGICMKWFRNLTVAHALGVSNGQISIVSLHDFSK